MLIGFDASRISVRNKTGVENYSTRLLHWLKTTSPKNSLRSFRASPKNQYILYTPRASDAEFKRLPSNFRLKEIPFPRLWTQVRLALEVWRDKPDILFIPSHVMPFLTRAKTIVTIHDVAFKYFPQHYSRFSRWYLDVTTRWAVKQATKIITISESTKNDLIKFYGAKGNKIEVVYLGFDGEKKVVSAEKKDSTLKKFKITKPYVFYLGRVESKKNIVNLIRAFSKILEKGEKLQLVLGGKAGYGFEEIKKTIKEYNLEGKIVLMGYLTEEEKNCLLQSASVFVLVSLYEGFGIPALEAMARGVPVVLSKIPVFEELFKEVAILVNPNQPEEIAEGIIDVLKDTKKRREFIRKGKEVVKKFSWEKTAKETLRVLEN